MKRSRILENRSARGLTLLATIVSAATFLSLGTAHGDEPRSPARPSKKPTAPVTEPRNDPENVTAISLYLERVLEGNRRFLQKDYNGAYEIYRKAAQLNPKQALGPYLIGEVAIAQNNMGEAEAAFKQAEALADGKDALLRAAILFSVADVFERQKKWDQAKVAWRAYTEFAAKQGSALPAAPSDGGGVPHVGSGEVRIKAIDDALKLAADYALVRERIAKEGDGGAAAAKSAPKK